MSVRLGSESAAALLLPIGTCPACWPAYAGFLGTLGLGFLLNDRYLLPVAAAFLAPALASLVYRARSRRGYAPFALGLAGSLSALVAKFTLSSTALLYLGLAGLVAAGAWNAWPARDAAPAPCENCAPQERRAESI